VQRLSESARWRGLPSCTSELVKTVANWSIVPGDLRGALRSGCNRVQLRSDRQVLSGSLDTKRPDCASPHHVEAVRSVVHSAVNESSGRPGDRSRTSSESQESQAQSLDQFAQRGRLSLGEPDHRESEAQSSGRTRVGDEPTSFLGEKNWQKPETTLSSTPPKRRTQRYEGGRALIACCDVPTMYRRCIDDVASRNSRPPHLDTLPSGGSRFDHPAAGSARARAGRTPEQLRAQRPHPGRGAGEQRTGRLGTCGSRGCIGARGPVLRRPARAALVVLVRDLSRFPAGAALATGRPLSNRPGPPATRQPAAWPPVDPLLVHPRFRRDHLRMEAGVWRGGLGRGRSSLVLACPGLLQPGQTLLVPTDRLCELLAQASSCLSSPSCQSSANSSSAPCRRHRRLASRPCCSRRHQAVPPSATRHASGRGPVGGAPPPRPRPSSWVLLAPVVRLSACRHSLSLLAWCVTH